ncbi:cbb3-type cytochrome c oxidase subunit I [uncultured Nocardioides sp.]|uniref:cytochrome c oxidase subunit I n=1 Tax=uncultured Nocardioides sp. TaxID=198441 RepID=UPI00262A2C3C|nr:cbb3-type cytochrome c oxidase subunit I [uncultured Nocardioides sp.]
MTATAAHPTQQSGRKPLGELVVRMLTTTDHKLIGKMYLITSFAWFLVGGVMALLIRAELFAPGSQVVNDELYNQLFTMHGTIMLLLFATPLFFGFANVIMPLQIGSPDVAFPRLNMFSYWLFLFGGLIAASGFLTPQGAADFGWFAYTPLSDAVRSPGVGGDLWIMGLWMAGLGSILGAVNFITTIICMRAPGLTMFRLPIFVWNVLITSLLVLVAFPILAGALLSLEADRLLGAHVFDTAHGGAILWQHLFWFFGHPEVYVVMLPAIGITIDIVATFARKKLFGYKLMLYTTVATGVLSFFVWAHHQFISGIDPRMANVFMVTTLLISVPIAELMFVIIATLYGGSIRLATPMLWALAFIAEFLIGGVTGIFLGASGADIYFHDTYFVLAHFHYTFFPIAIIGTFAGLTYWFPKMFGKMMSDKLGKIHFWGTIIPFNFIFIPLFVLGMGGQHRRIYNFQHFPDLAGADFQRLRIIATVALLVMLAFQLVFFYNFIRSLLRGEKAPKNPWNANTLEWTTESPPPHGNWPPDQMPKVYRGPYEYGRPDRESDFWPQDEPA